MSKEKDPYFVSAARQGYDLGKLAEAERMENQINKRSIHAITEVAVSAYSTAAGVACLTGLSTEALLPFMVATGVVIARMVFAAAKNEVALRKGNAESRLKSPEHTVVVPEVNAAAHTL